jgi:hypothetical protein
MPYAARLHHPAEPAAPEHHVHTAVLPTMALDASSPYPSGH